MSLDDRLRSGLRTLETAPEDAQQRLAEFRRRAYPRRARRWVAQGVAGMIVAAALAFGISSLALHQAQGSGGFVNKQPKPKGVPNCTPSDLHFMFDYSTGPAGLVSFGYASSTRPCWIDQSITVAITGNGFADLKAGRLFAVSGNNSAIRLRGVVPTPNADARAIQGLGISWEWSNWCGSATRAYFVFFETGKHLQIADDMLEMDPAPNTPRCVDRSKPSVLTSAPSVASFPSTRRNDLPLVLQPAPGLANPRVVKILGVYLIDARTLWAFFTEAPCTALDHVTVSESPQQVTVFVYVGRQSKSSCHPTNLPNIAAKIVLSRALGNRGVADGASGEVLGVASSR